MLEKYEKDLICKIRKNKINIYIFGTMLIFTSIICSNLFKMHFSQDTYSVYSSGWDEYIRHFLLSNRIFSAFELWVSKVLSISFENTILISTVIAIIAFSLSWFILYKFTIKLLKKEQDKFYNILIIGITFSIIYNFCTFETIIFIEAGVMAFSILLSVIAACLYTNKKYLLSFVILLTSSFCYQTAIDLFVLITLVFIAYENRNNIKEIFKKSIGVLILFRNSNDNKSNNDKSI